VPGLLDRLDDSSAGAVAVQGGLIEELDLDSWSRGPVLLVGDAAHATSPNMAEGAAMALEDAIVLAESLGSAADVAAGLALFEQRRRPRTDWVREQTHRRDHARGLPPVVRNLVLRRLGRRIFLGNYEPLREPA
jgi:2-polyprenyl-6-methoxyphenol hydroxylase-like FAD-dependent oxidoreductase